jgi:hypothetical protein
VTQSSFVRIIEGTVDALTYLHNQSIAHLDLKPGNILIERTGLPVIADLGTAKSLVYDVSDTIVACTTEYADPDLLSLLNPDPSSQNRARGTIARSRIRPTWDLFALGKTLLSWLGYGPRGEAVQTMPFLDPYARKYLLLMVGRLLRGSVDPWLEDRIGLDRRLLGELKYLEASKVLEDVRKLSGQYSLLDSVPELNAYHPKVIQVAGDSPTTYSERLEKLIEHPAMRRLASISQLGLVRSVYPTATHSRLEHSLGTYHNACRFVLSLYYDPLSPLFRQIVDASDVCAVLVAALLHDVGQYPLAHDLEEIDGNMFGQKGLALALIRGVRATKKPGAQRLQLQPPLDDVLKPWGVTPERLIQILEARPDRDDASVKDRLLHSIIDGPVDADKLDYLRRDSDRLKVPYGYAIDAERILRSLTCTLDRRGKGLVACVGVHEKAKAAAEFIAIARYAMFSQVYWHHAARAAKAMLARAVLKLLTVAEDHGERWRNRFRTEFERFVFRLPALLYRGWPVQARLFDLDAVVPSAARAQAVASQTTGVDATPISGGEANMAATDAAVIGFLRAWLERDSAKETELLDDLLARRLYKRLFVFSYERGGKEWRSLLERWDALAVSKKIKVYNALERALLVELESRLQEGPPTETLSTIQANRLRGRIGAEQPVLLLDVPGPRPGSDVPLYYVVEAQRRALRRDERAVGDVQTSEIWSDFTTGLRERTGKIRVFCHPEVVDSVEALIARDDFVRLFEKAVAQIT